MLRLITYCLVFCFATLVGCKSDKDNVVRPNLNYNYAGLLVGNYVIYNVDSIFYNDLTNSADTFQYQIKEKLESQITDLQGDPSFRIERYKKHNDSIYWELVDVWNSKITTTNYQKVEENIRYVKLIFPVRANKTWDGNNFNNEGQMMYEYTAIHQPENIGGHSLDSVATVIQQNDINLISQQLYEEKFATKIGMVYQKRLSRKRANLSAPWLGFDVTMILATYGNE